MASALWRAAGLSWAPFHASARPLDPMESIPMDFAFREMHPDRSPCTEELQALKSAHLMPGVFACPMKLHLAKIARRIQLLSSVA
jgi:hypothetical protein